MTKKWTYGLSILMLCLSIPNSFAHTYDDLNTNDAGFYAVDYLRERGVYRPTKSFKPELYLTRANFIVDLIKLNAPNFNKNIVPKLPFEDTENNSWYAPYFQQAIEMGILDPNPVNANPYKNLSAIEALTFLFRSKSLPIARQYNGEIPYIDLINSPHAALAMQAIDLNLYEPMSQSHAAIYQSVSRLEEAQMIYEMEQFSELLTAPKEVYIEKEYAPELQKFIDAWQHINEHYYNDYNKDDAIDEALEALVNSLGDEYSLYMDADGTKQFFDGTDSEIEGIGAVIDMNGEDVVVVSPLAGSPAEGAGLKSGDIIRKVDGMDTGGMGMIEVISHIKGPKGTSVEITIDREGEALTLSIVRDLIEIKSIQNEIIENGNIYHIDISQFNVEANEEFEVVMNQFLTDEKAKGIIIDLRGNPGGFLDVTVDILSHYVDYLELIVRIQYKEIYQELLGNANGDLANIPTVVLIDQGSASASEIVAGVLQDYKLATIIGETSFGKGTVQHIQHLSDSSSLKLTVAEWSTPLEQVIQGEGIHPDIEAIDNPGTEADEVLKIAIETLKKKINAK